MDKKRCVWKHLKFYSDQQSTQLLAKIHNPPPRCFLRCVCCEYVFKMAFRYRYALFAFWSVSLSLSCVCVCVCVCVWERERERWASEMHKITTKNFEEDLQQNFQNIFLYFKPRALWMVSCIYKLFFNQNNLCML